VCAPAHRGVGVAARREHDHVGGQLVADHFVAQVGEVGALGIEHSEQLGKYETVTAEPNRTRPGVGGDEIEDVTAVAMQAPHRVD